MYYQAFMSRRDLISSYLSKTVHWQMLHFKPWACLSFHEPRRHVSYTITFSGFIRIKSKQKNEVCSDIRTSLGSITIANSIKGPLWTELWMPTSRSIILNEFRFRQECSFFLILTANVVFFLQGTEGAQVSYFVFVLWAVIPCNELKTHAQVIGDH